MKIEFEDKSFIECIMSDTPDKVIITISAKDADNKLKKIINSVEISVYEFKKLTAIL